MSDQNEQMIGALLTERAGYVRRALPARVAGVDEQLRLRGYDVSGLPAIEQPGQEQPGNQPPRDRHGPSRQKGA